MDSLVEPQWVGVNELRDIRHKKENIFPPAGQTKLILKN